MSTPTSDELKREAIKRGIRARVDQIKRHLFRWIQQNRSPVDAMPMMIALLEIAIDRHLVITENPDDTLDFVNKTCQRLVHKPIGRMQ
jgi:hypothetical protein